MPGAYTAAPHLGQPYMPYGGVVPGMGMPMGMMGGGGVGSTYAAQVNSQGQPSFYNYQSGHAGSGRYPQPHPVVNPGMPAAHMTNSTGGLGCEPGYNYFFPQEHTKVHVLKSGATPPWQVPPNFTIPFHACHVPTSTTVGNLLKGFGANNSRAKFNTVTEVVQGGNGRWYRGLAFDGSDKDAMQRPIKDLGWDKTRSGLPGAKPVVYLYITKD